MVSTQDYVIVIPARYASERLPGKMLLDVYGRPLLQHAWERARASSASEVIIATDHARIESAARAFGADVLMTSPDHPSGSDRIAECAERRGWAEDRVVVNLQGDEPLMPPACLDQVAELLERHPLADVATLYANITQPDEVDDPNVVKVVARNDGRAVYFSRSAIPHARGFASPAEAISAGVRWRRHLGLYAYRRKALDWFVKTPATPLEQAERLEQLRFIEFGRQVVLARTRAKIPPGVDTQRDLERVAAVLAAGGLDEGA